MTRPRAADDFAAIRARLAELRRERAQLSGDGGPAPAEEARAFHIGPRLVPGSERIMPRIIRRCWPS